MPDLTHVWWWRTVRPDRKGQPCRVLTRARGPGPRNVCVEFADGEQVITPMWAVRKAPA
jgi:hypothetical protein